MVPARDLEEQLSAVPGAAVVNMKELLKDIRAMEAGMKLMQRELEWHGKLKVGSCSSCACKQKHAQRLTGVNGRRRVRRRSQGL